MGLPNGALKTYDLEGASIRTDNRRLKYPAQKGLSAMCDFGMQWILTFAFDWGTSALET